MTEPAGIATRPSTLESTSVVAFEAILDLRGARVQRVLQSHVELGADRNLDAAAARRRVDARGRRGRRSRRRAQTQSSALRAADDVDADAGVGGERVPRLPTSPRARERRSSMRSRTSAYSLRDSVRSFRSLTFR